MSMASGLPLDPANAGRLLARGYSCCSRARHFHIRLLHPLQGLFKALRPTSSSRMSKKSWGMP